MEQHAIKLFNIYAHWPLALMFAYGAAFFLPLSASRFVACVVGLAISWGLVMHFDDNLAWWVNTWAHTAVVPDMNAPEGLDMMLREAYVRGFFTCVCCVLAALLVLVPLVADSYIRSAIAMRARLATAKGPLPPL